MGLKYAPKNMKPIKLSSQELIEIILEWESHCQIVELCSRNFKQIGELKQ